MVRCRLRQWFNHDPRTQDRALRRWVVRSAPLFPELRVYLEAARELADDDAEFVIANPRLRRWNANLGTSATKILLRAGFKPWPKLFQNLRAELYPAKDVAAWLGNSVPVAMEHYAMAPPADWRGLPGMDSNHE